MESPALSLGRGALLSRLNEGPGQSVCTVGFGGQ